MRSPFPGVDPYLEDQFYWPDLHPRFLNYWCEALADRLPEHYEARLDERVNLVDVHAGDQLIKPDVAIVHASTGEGSASTGPTGTAVLKPVVIPLPVSDEERQAYIQILHRPDKSLVAVLELLSPFHKTGDGYSIYCDRRNSLLWRTVHLVELDLLKGGNRLPMRRPLPTGDYYALVARAGRRPDCEVYAWNIRQSLPVIGIPLKQPDQDIQIDLAVVFQTAFERGRYARSIDYTKPLGLPFDDETKNWAGELTRQPGL